MLKTVIVFFCAVLALLQFGTVAKADDVVKPTWDGAIYSSLHVVRSESLRGRIVGFGSIGTGRKAVVAIQLRGEGGEVQTIVLAYPLVVDGQVISCTADINAALCAIHTLPSFDPDARYEVFVHREGAAMRTDLIQRLTPTP